MIDSEQYDFLDYVIESENEDCVTLQAEIPDSSYVIRVKVSKKGNEKFLLAFNNESDKGEKVDKC